MSAENLVIVESPAKAKTINKYLGSNFDVIASYGHIRDLPPKDGSVRPDEDFAMDWAPSDRSTKQIREISQKAKAATNIYLATDPDREGEAISWHIKEILQNKKLLNKRQLHRVTFNEITKTAVQEAFANNVRDLDNDLIDAYLARRALDYLVGFSLSPVLWRKLPGSRSAGRVQSVALRLICERETEIEAFKADEYWSIEAKLQTPDGAPFKARLTHLSGNKLDKLDIGSEAEASAAAARIQSKNLKVHKIEKKEQRRNPAAPFITSTMQQEAARKLGFGASQTMRVAQKLYEGIDVGGETVGLITYMRTDGTTLSQDAVNQARNLIVKDYGDKYLPSSPRLYKSKAKNAQEAHEAIRPTDLTRTPASLRGYLDDQMFRLYDLIWKRTMASQMQSAVMDKMSVDLSDGTDDVILRANGSVVTFDGFLTLYFEHSDDDSSGDDDANNPLGDRRLPPMNEGDATSIQKVDTEQHFTQPPPRYTEASLVKKMEELGIGRPSTYASIIQVLQDRDYVVLEKKRFTPQDRGRIVTAFLIKFFPRLMDYSFTASLEDELDAISAGQAQWRQSLRDFWTDFARVVEETKGLTITQVIDYLNEELGAHFFPPKEDGSPARSCPTCKDGEMSLKLGKFGAFVGCSNYPECKFTRPLVAPDQDDEAAKASAEMSSEPQVLGKDTHTGREISLRKGPYGPYVQLESEEGTKDKPKRQGLPRGTNPKDVDLQAAIKLLALPREVGLHPETGLKIEAGIGRFGPFLKHQGVFTSLPKGDDVLTIGMNRAVEVIAVAAEKKAKKEAEKAAKAAAGGADGKKSTAKKSTAKKTSAKKTTAKKKAPAKKAATKKKATKKTTAKKTTKADAT